MARHHERYNEWLHNPYFDRETQAELQAIAGNEREIEDRFHRELEFGTGGLRGVIGAGTNRMNRYVVRRVTQGLANYIRQLGSDASKRGVAIAYDSRHFSDQFAMETALVLAGNGIRVWLFPDIQPTPVLSFAVRQLGAQAGVVITASHNPKEYNGYKVYGSDGGQATPTLATAIYREVERVADFTSIQMAESCDEAQAAGLLHWIGAEVTHSYVQHVTALIPTGDQPQRSECHILYTPLHGAGYDLVPHTLRQVGFTRVAVVREQAQPDPTFPTLHTPNPEERDAYNTALATAAKTEPDIILATDADADRLGVLVHSNDQYTMLTGNQIGVLLLDYLLRRETTEGTLSADAVVIKTIVSTEMADAIAQSYGVHVINTLTGFKFIGEQIGQLEEANSGRFLFGFEESYGYLTGTFIRDKDAIISAVLLAELASECKANGMTLLDRLDQLFEQYGYYEDELYTISLPGKKGMERIQQLMQQVREQPIWQIAEMRVERINDYWTGFGTTREGGTIPLILPQADVIAFHFEQGGYFVLRPSGTEPKLKMYLCIVADSKEEARALLHNVKENALQRFELF